MIQKGRSEPESVASAIGLHGPAVDYDGGAGSFAGVDIGRHFVTMCFAHQWTHIRVLCAVAGFQAQGAILDLCNQLIGDVPDRDQCGDRHAALTGGAEARVHHRVGGQIEVASGRTTAWFFAPPSAWTRLLWAVAVS